MALSPARWFRFDEHGTSYRQEVTGGVTTFVTMAYIVVLNPAILGPAGIPAGPSTVATILVAGISHDRHGARREPSDRRRPLHGRERLHRIRASRDSASAGSCGSAPSS